MCLLPLKEVKITKVNVLLLLLSHFLHLIFTLNSVDFVEGGARIFLATGPGYPSYATDLSLLQFLQLY